ncbi:twin-arginine translocase subunit TatC [Corallincola luteus]|uniref:Sec-independent protein translocase protein TatC n=2 Tax=Corallincola TaxID=1775176 RepID=A0A368N4K5_9GAMM|nr:MULTISPECIES: twin-arginine translocase subunit TatC [Corallincola]RCU45487.1 twin-arginine translocase subunit TatC [Corallincola holothuriorum]TCI02651.1 twin-arginine translocase subunit TatC [Corallincola luteus]
MNNPTQQPFLSHLYELRDRLLKALGSVLVIFLGLVYFSQEIYHFIAAPLIAEMPDGASMIATDVASPFFVPIKLTIVLSAALAVPFILHQVWAFIAPGLYKHERKLALPLVVMSSLLFYAGAAFAFFVVFPLAFGFLTAIAPEGVTIATDIGSYLDFVLKLFFAFGLAFEVPILIIVLCWVGITTPESLSKKRPYIIVAAFVFGMLLTPPDIFSQTLLAIPMLLLFEVGLLIARLYRRKDDEQEEE